MTTELLPVGAARWTAALAACRHDFYHLPEYVALSARQTSAEPAALLVRDGPRSMLLPIVIGAIPGGDRDAVTPYGYSGPITSVEDGDFLRDALLEGYERLKAEGLVSLFIRCHPLLEPVPRVGAGTVVHHGDTVAIDLGRSEEQLWRDTRRDHRSGIRRAQAAGHRVVFDPSWDHFDEFVRIYLATMRRVEADESYAFDADYFRGLRSALGDRLNLVIVDIDGAVAAAGLFVASSGIVQFHLSGTDERFLGAAPSKIMLHGVRTWAKARGDRWLHLGGGLGAGNDSLFLFKSGFSPLRFPFHTVRVVLRPEEYRRLSGDDRADQDVASGFFPRYRRPEGI